MSTPSTPVSAQAAGAREAARHGNGKFGVQPRAEVVDVDLTDDALPSREELLADPVFAAIPSDWLEPKTDEELAEVIADYRARKAAFAAKQAEEEAAAAAETARRRAYRRPEWLHRHEDGNWLSYSTDDGYKADAIEQRLDGVARTRYLVRSPENQDIADVDRVELVEQAITKHRADEQAKATWTEAFPYGSAAAGVAAFKGKPVDEWWWDGNQGDACLITADGSYASVTHDEEPTGHWFIDGAWADGSALDGGAWPSRAEAKAAAEEALADGKQEHERKMLWRP